jgi:cell division protein FtsN
MRSSVPPTASRSRQRGGFLAGLIVGLLIGLALALGVALYVTKVPVPFLDKVPQRTAEQDSAEREKNKNWEPNAPLAGKNPARPLPIPVTPAPSEPATAAPGERDPAGILADRPVGPTPPPAAKPAPTAPAAKTGDEAYVFFVQTGAYSSVEDAEAQRGKLALLGYSARIVEREQAGRTVHRVRLGPFEDKAEADDIKAKVSAVGFEAALVRAPR